MSVVPTASEPRVRPLIIGALIGGLLAVVNTYVGLKIGITDPGSVTAVLIAVGLGALLVRLGGAAMSAHEVNTVQTTAVAAAGMANAIGLSGGAAALVLVGAAPSLPALAGLGLGTALLAIAVAVVLRASLIERQQLPFPSGQVTAELIAVVQRIGQRGRGLALAATASAAAVIVWFRDARPAIVPGLVALPAPATYSTPAALGYGLAPSPLMVGVGFLIGAPTALAIGLGSAIAWGVIGPWLVADRGVAPTYDGLSGWLVWPGLALILAGSATSLVRDWRTGRGKLTVPSPRRAAIALVVAAAVGVVAVAGLDAPVLAVAIGLAVAPVLGLVGARVAGESDISPAGPFGAVAQVAIAPVGASAAGVLVPSTIASGVVAHSAVALWAFKTGHLLGAPWRRQVPALVLGSVVGAAVAMPVFGLLRDAYTLGGAELPAPFAQTWTATTRALLDGSAGLPSGALVAAGIAAVVGAVLALAAGPGWRRFVPSPTAVGIGFLLPVSYALPIVIGGVVVGALGHRRPAIAAALPIVGTGAILGEATIGTIIAGLRVGGGLS